MTPIRPAGAPPIPTAQPPRADAARLEAQKAFFALAGKPPTAAAAPAATVAPQAAAAPQRTLAATPAETPSRPLRPGSLLDIRV